jgi:membrane-associated phospholipid phosphatase
MSKAKTTAKKLHDADRELGERAAAERQSGPMRVLAAVNELSDQPPLIALSAATLVAGLVSRRSDLTRGGARMLASHLLATAIKTAVKRNVDRTRPHSVDDGYDYRLKKGESRSHHYSSFPSGHTAGAVAVAQAVARDYPQHAAAARSAAGSIGLFQFARRAHFPTDILAGAIVGVAAEAVVDRVIRLVWTAQDRKVAGAGEGIRTLDPDLGKVVLYP